MLHFLINVLLFALPQISLAETSWRQNKIWDDGNAEVSLYNITWARYGHMYPGQAQMILVKEPWAPDLNVKADRPRDKGYDVFKLNTLRDVPTGVYTYHQMVSSYVRRDNVALVKLSATSSEACGVSSAYITNGQLQTRSYFDGEGDRTLEWPQHVIAEDTLPIVLRDYITKEPPRGMALYPSFLSNRFHEHMPVIYEVSKKDMNKVVVPAGSFKGVVFRFEKDKTFMSFTLNRDFPHQVLVFEKSDGTKYTLKKTERFQYWKFHNPEDKIKVD